MFSLITRIKLKKLLQHTDWLHLGCNLKKINGFINLDIRKTSATDLVWDCVNLTIFESNSISLIFTSAFLEHLYLNQRQIHLTECSRVLRNNGILFEANIPYFPVVAQQYLNKGKGIFKDIFDIEHVYHYTHGMPEAQPDWWLEQLHKSLFDLDSIIDLLNKSGFKHYLIVNHTWREEEIPVSFSFLASKNKKLKLSDFKVLSKKLDPNINVLTSKILALK